VKTRRWAGCQNPIGDWAARQRRSGHSAKYADEPAGLRFAFYGRTSTTDHQDRVSSAGWQREAAEELIGGHGTIVAEFFDAGCSRRRAWTNRPQAAALLAALADPGHRFDAIVVGEYERAITGTQFARMAGLFKAAGIQVWLPKAGGPVDAHSPEHRILMAVLGAQSQREVLRSRYRVLAAMRTMARLRAALEAGGDPEEINQWIAETKAQRLQAEAELRNL
jgi:site-specific DNA recombinase